ncbi:hypothetical protein TSOC_002303 [Tetrabaena socialis]|uniref:Uncharacterized protein n=1 Tax=Tetrabaena socialis TaxID=47790 RepID=A0A2J8AEJ6_9CHLO|nr:hypothetical protein TSOC_002303 [Tetrabaena socialis]|eukprot:PNH10929.1 hypothetical protein TSOC_002303 [Tetrabaena socialis]
MELLQGLPIPRSSLDVWWLNEEPTIVAAATAWHTNEQVRKGVNAAAILPLDGQTLFNFYLARLEAYFAKDRKDEALLNFKQLRQAKDGSPSMFLRAMRLLEPQLGGAIPPESFASSFMAGLDPEVRVSVSNKYVTVPREEWYNQLSAIAADADVTTASEGWLPPGELLKAQFLANKQDLLGKAPASTDKRKAVAASVKAEEEPEEGYESEYEDDYRSTHSHAHAHVSFAHSSTSSQHDATLTPAQSRLINVLRVAAFVDRTPDNCSASGPAAPAPHAVALAAQHNSIVTPAPQEQPMPEPGPVGTAEALATLTAQQATADQCKVLLAEMIPSEEMAELLASNLAAAGYFKAKQYMFYDPSGGLALKGFPGKLAALRDQCANTSLMSVSAARRLGLTVIKTTTRLTSSSQPDSSALGELDTQGVMITLLPGTPHAVDLPLTQTLVVSDSPLFNYLAGNEQMRSVADYVTQYPTAQLHFKPNIVEAPEHTLAMPMTKGPESKNALASFQLQKGEAAVEALTAMPSDGQAAILLMQSFQLQKGEAAVEACGGCTGAAAARALAGGTGGGGMEPTRATDGAGDQSCAATAGNPGSCGGGCHGCQYCCGSGCCGGTGTSYRSSRLRCDTTTLADPSRLLGATLLAA